MTANETEGQRLDPPGLGPVDRQLAVNLLRARNARGLSTTRLSAALKEFGQPIPPTGITRIEKGQRHVSASELIALGEVLNVDPMMLVRSNLTVTVIVNG